ncbi:hypothetical protein B0T09DRAFT_401931, partial [Sordaria sp. MPI-SDFR-AT-0083]
SKILLDVKIPKSRRDSKHDLDENTDSERAWHYAVGILTLLGSCQKLSQDGRFSINSQYSMREVGRTDTVSGNFAHDLAKPIEQLQNVNITAPVESVSCSTDALEYNLDSIRMWLENCERTHTVCRVALAAQDFLPTRLLDLKAFRDDIRLVHIQPNKYDGNDKLPSYVTLSHC